MILIEGADGLGKTTLAKALQAKLGCAYVHHGPPKPDWRMSDFLNVLPNAVYDRFHWSMYAYRLARHQPLGLSIADCCAIDKALKLQLDHSYCPVLLYHSGKDYLADSPEDPMFDKETILRVNDEYMSVIEHFDVAIDVAKGYPTAEQVLDLAWI